MEIVANAKINWDLKVLGKRPDGFHELDTVMVSIELADRISIAPASSLSMTCSDPSLPCNEDNLAIRSALRLRDASGVQKGAAIHLEKSIPHGGGLGGGSSDAAGVLEALNELWEVNWPRERLAKIAADIGSDVPYFLWGGWCRCRGRGEIVEPLAGAANWPPVTILLILPALSISTPAVYRALQAKQVQNKEELRSLTHIEEGLSISIFRPQEGEKRPCGAGNDLLEAARTVEPRLRDLHKALDRHFTGSWSMSGSGAAHFLVLDRKRLDQKEVQARLREVVPFSVSVVETTTVSPRRQSP